MLFPKHETSLDNGEVWLIEGRIIEIIFPIINFFIIIFNIISKYYFIWLIEGQIVKVLFSSGGEYMV